MTDDTMDQKPDPRKPKNVVPSAALRGRKPTLLTELSLGGGTVQRFDSQPIIGDARAIDWQARIDDIQYIIFGGGYRDDPPDETEQAVEFWRNTIVPLLTRKRLSATGEAARWLATVRGWHVFPVPPGTKSSHYAKADNGVRWGATRDPAVVEKYWRKHPNAGVGIAMGESGLVDIEGDTPEGHDVDGLASLDRLAEQHGPWPVTPMYESPTGSLHRLYQAPAGVVIKSSTGELAPGVDIKGSGGMALAPPTRTKRGLYRWLTDEYLAPAPLPQWIVDWSTNAAGPQVNGKASAFGNNQQPLDDAELAACVAAIKNPADMDRAGWTRVGMGIVSAEANDFGFRLFDDFSKRWEKPDGYDAEATQQKWRELLSSPPRDITVGTLIWMATNDTPNWRRQQRQAEAHADYAQRRAEQIEENRDIGETVVEPNLPTILTVDEMLEQLVYIGHGGAVVHRLTGRVRRREDAPGEYAASVYVPPKGRPVPHLKIWINHNDRKAADALVWVPGEPEFCSVPEKFGGHDKGYNLWRGLKPMPAPLDWQLRSQPFLEHVEYLVTIESERRRFLQWLAHIAQRPEVLPHTTWLMVTPTHGIGRNLLESILVRVFPGHVAAGISLDELTSETFNGRLSQKLLYIIDELREGPGGQRYQRENNLRKASTMPHRLINPKYGVQSIEINCCRGLIFSNFHDALPFDEEDRRYEVVDNPTVPKDANYYTKMYAMLQDPLFIASVRQSLQAMDISTFNPGARAELNEAKKHAILVMRTDIDQGLRDFKEECETKLVSRADIEMAVDPGHSVSTAAFTHAIQRAGMGLTGRQVKDVGYGKENKTRHTVVIIDKNAWTVQMVKDAAPQMLLKAMGKPSEAPYQKGRRG